MLRKIGVVAALPLEGRLLAGRRLARGTPIQLGPRTLVHCAGTGGQNAENAARSLLAKGAESLVSWGFAGGLDPRLPSGTLLLAESIAAPDRGETLIPDNSWRERLSTCLKTTLPVNTGSLQCVNRPVENTGDKARLFEDGHAGVDMESFAIAQAARQADVPFVCIRAIADPASLALPRMAVTAMDAQGRMRWAAFLRALAHSNPREILSLIRLGRASRRAGHTLRAVRRLAGLSLQAPE